MAAADHPFVLARATAEDVPEICAMLYDAFWDVVRQVIFGCFSKDDLPRLIEHYKEEMESDPSDVWIKVTEVHTGAIVAASNWKLYSNSSMKHGLDEPKPWVKDEEALKLAHEMLDPMNELRLKTFAGQPFLHLHICATAASVRRQGAGGMMLQWGSDTADLLFLPGWIEASPEGETSPVTAMWRDN